MKTQEKKRSHISILIEGYANLNPLFMINHELSAICSFDNGFKTVEVDKENEQAALNLILSKYRDRIKDIKVHNSRWDARYYRDEYWKQ